MTDPESAWAVETYTTEPGKADRLTGKLAVVDFESTLRKFLPCSRRKITGGKRGKSRHSSRFRASASTFFGSLGHLFGPSHIGILDRDAESIILGNGAGRALERK